MMIDDHYDHYSYEYIITYIYINMIGFPRMIIILSSIIIQNDFTTWQLTRPAVSVLFADRIWGIIQLSEKHDSFTNKTCHWIGLREKFNRKPMGFYHQI